MSPKIDKLERHSVKSLLKQTLLKTIENSALYLSDFLQTKEPESLHQYRVNIRMARSICLEFGTFMDKKRQKALLQKLKALQLETNEMRDLDVFLECIEAYKSKVEPSCLGEFESIEKQLEMEKEEAYKVFEAKYNTSMKAKMLMELHNLQCDEKLYLPKAEEKILKHLKVILEKRLKKIHKISKKLSIDAPNELFHTLRLHYKKMRYSVDAVNLDTFASHFKPIQSAFGKVQDKNTQIERIKQYNSNQRACLEQIIALLEQELIQDKQVCIEKSHTKRIQKIQTKLQKIFKRKKR